MDIMDKNFGFVIMALIGGALIIFIFGVLAGAGTAPITARGFSCTESAVIEGNAMCVKYERNK